MASPQQQHAVRAAGAVLWRTGTTAEVEVAVVHRPRYDDWSLPKGKVDPGETAAGAAVREVLEETGFHAVLGRLLPRVTYQTGSHNSGTADKVVDYFAARNVGGQFQPNDEVDELRWLSVSAAEPVLSYDSDRDVLRAFAALPAELITVLLVRHAKAGKREEWNGDDDLRPLSPAGLRQAQALRTLLPLFAPGRVFSAPRLRCVRTVKDIADDMGIEVQHEELFSEDSYFEDRAGSVNRLLSIAAAGDTPVICSQGGVIPDLVSALADRDGIDIEVPQKGKLPSKKGSVWLLSFRSPAVGAEPRLVAAGYVPSALPLPEPAPLG